MKLAQNGLIDGRSSQICVADRYAQLLAYATRVRGGNFTCRRAFAVEASGGLYTHYSLCRGSSHTYSLRDTETEEMMIYCPPSFAPGYERGRWLPAFQSRQTALAIDVSQDLLVTTDCAPRDSG